MKIGKERRSSSHPVPGLEEMQDVRSSSFVRGMEKMEETRYSAPTFPRMERKDDALLLRIYRNGRRMLFSSCTRNG